MEHANKVQKWWKKEYKNYFEHMTEKNFFSLLYKSQQLIIKMTYIIYSFKKLLFCSVNTNYKKKPWR